MEKIISNEQIELLKARMEDPKFPYLNKDLFQKFLDGELKDFSSLNLEELFKLNKKIQMADSFKENILHHQESFIVINLNPVVKFYDIALFEDNTSILERLIDSNHSLITLDQLYRVILEHPFPRKYNKQDFESKCMFKIDESENLFFMKGKRGNTFCVILRFSNNLHKWYLSAEEILAKGHRSGTRVFTS